MTKWLTRIALLPLFVVSLMAGNWQFQSVFHDYQLPRDDGYGIHGTVVAPDGNVWVAMHGPVAGDTLFVDNAAGGVDTVGVRPIHVFTPAGEHASYSPIRFVGSTAGNNLDTLIYSGKGMCLDIDGNIIYATNKLYRFNYQTGEMSHSYDVAYDESGTLSALSAPSVDQDGNIYVGWVAGATKPIVKVSSDFSSQSTVADAGINYNRATLVTPDANRIFLGSTWNGVGVTVLESNMLGTAYDSVDTYGNVMVADTTALGADTTVQANLWVEALEWNLGVLWAGETDPAWSTSHPLAGSWVGLNPTTGAIIDTLGIGTSVLATDDASALAATGVTCNPRGMGSSADGLTLYVSDFSTNVIQVWTNADPVTVAIDEEGNAPIVAEGYALYQAYPNPFNPSTKIKYEVGRTGNAKMEIFNMKGQFVRTLVNEWHFNGEHEIVWNGRDNSGMRVPSGTYIYRLSSVDVTFSKSVTLLK